MVDRTTQDNTEQFQGALEIDLLYWEQFFHLEQHERPDAIQLLVDNNVLTTEKAKHYEVKLNIRGINSAARNFEYGQDRLPLYFTTEEDADTLVEFCKDKGGSKLTEHD